MSRLFFANSASRTAPRRSSPCSRWISRTTDPLATIKVHITPAFRKLGVKNRTQAVIALQQMDIKED
ncbi:LuxR C-terminal-related transcriptional regulator [Aeromonas salmonicida]|uniref:LuxR C-terminal-related transcriptional regulator n=1 Tax=Aeromonas salmonicida TaxID=645 RepID=UPI003BF61AAE